jgi:GNAT superfamily N-acetyltransferase
MSFLVRKAGPADCGALARLRFDFVQELDPTATVPDELLAANQRYFATQLGGAGPVTCWLAEVDGAAVAQAMLILLPKPPSLGIPTGLEGYVSNFFIAAAHRRRGIGQALLDALTAEARLLGVDKLWLHATGDGELLYTRAGFTRVDRSRYPEMALVLVEGGRAKRGSTVGPIA